MAVSVRASLFFRDDRQGSPSSTEDVNRRSKSVSGEAIQAFKSSTALNPKTLSRSKVELCNQTIRQPHLRLKVSGFVI